MPLPKPPAKRADFLSRDAFESQGAAGKRARRERPAAEPVGPRPCSSCRTKATLPAAAMPPRGARRRRAPAVASRAMPTRPEREKKRPRGNGPTTLFVLDTNVLMHDPTSLFRFEEHDIYLPMITLEELDGHKKRHDRGGAQCAAR